MKRLGVFSRVSGETFGRPRSVALHLRLPPSLLIRARCFASSDHDRNKAPPQGKTMETVQQVQERLNETKSWDDLWKNGLTPWDLGEPTPLLIKELEAQRQRLKQNDRTSVRTLVPGCGSGYDIVSLLEHHEALLDANNSITDSAVVGLDISPTSLERATEIVKEMEPHGKTRIELQCGDFFRSESEWETIYSSKPNDSQPREAGFDFIFDYTFFCALPPSLRGDWGERMSRLLVPSTGEILTVIFPILPDEDREKGPPYRVTIEDYFRSLEPVGILPESEPFESPHTVSSRQGKELVCYWKLKL